MTEVEIFTDGACRGNPGPGGWAALLVFGNERKEVSGSEAATTNNRMELSGAIGGLGALKRRCAVKPGSWPRAKAAPTVPRKNGCRTTGKCIYAPLLGMSGCSAG